MAKGSLFLPMTCGDFSGASAVLYSFGGGVLIVDPGGCAGDYESIEDPRVPDLCESVHSAALKEVEVSIGDYAHITKRAIQFVNRIDPPFVALVGSPVPSVIGMDLGSIASELENAVGKPVLVIETTGFTSYANGAFLATRALIERFGTAGDAQDGTVNILGLTPIDFEHMLTPAQARVAAEAAGYRVLCDFCEGSSIEDLSACPQAQLNIATSQAGVLVARWMKRHYGTPYKMAVALDGKLVEARACEQAIDEEPPLLIVGDEVVSHCLAAWMKEAGYQHPIVCATLFAQKRCIFEDTLRLGSDIDLIEVMAKQPFRAVIGDPLLTGLKPVSVLPFGTLPHPALSGEVYRHLLPSLNDSATLQRFLNL